MLKPRILAGKIKRFDLSFPYDMQKKDRSSMAIQGLNPRCSEAISSLSCYQSRK